MLTTRRIPGLRARRGVAASPALELEHGDATWGRHSGGLLSAPVNLCSVSAQVSSNGLAQQGKKQGVGKGVNLKPGSYGMAALKRRFNDLDLDRKGAINESDLKEALLKLELPTS